jgi:hypothetical protein
MQDMPMERMTYTVLSAGGAPVGGSMAPPSQAGSIPAHWART